MDELHEHEVELPEKVVEQHEEHEVEVDEMVVIYLYMLISLHEAEQLKLSDETDETEQVRHEPLHEEEVEVEEVLDELLYLSITHELHIL